MSLRTPSSTARVRDTPLLRPPECYLLSLLVFFSFLFPDSSFSAGAKTRAKPKFEPRGSRNPEARPSVVELEVSTREISAVG